MLNSPAELEQLRQDILAKRKSKQSLHFNMRGRRLPRHRRGARSSTPSTRKSRRKGFRTRWRSRGPAVPGFCERGPIVVIDPDETCYLQVTPKDVPEIVAQTVKEKQVVDRLVYSDAVKNEKAVREADIPFYKHQKRNIIGNNIKIDPKRIDDYLALGGYSALTKALFQMTPEQVVEEVKKSGLRGRGGGGFPTGIKWEAARKAPGETKYVIVNADEGDPGAFMDRAVLEGNPHSILEGLIIGAYAIGAHEGYVYVRQEYPLALENVGIAIKQAREYGFLGQNILGSGFDFDIKVHRGAGAFVCGEETALLLSLEGKPGEPRSAAALSRDQRALGQADQHQQRRNLGQCPADHQQRRRLVQPVRHRQEQGHQDLFPGRQDQEHRPGRSADGRHAQGHHLQNRRRHSRRQEVQGRADRRPGWRLHSGRTSRYCRSTSTNSIKVGAIMGSGGMIVMDEDTCMVDVARYFLNFLAQESCGKCSPCREGIKQMHRILTNITEGRGKEGDIELLEELAMSTGSASLCALGRTAPNPVLSTIRYFRHEYETHIKEKRCPSYTCQGLVSYYIDPAKCDACRICDRECTFAGDRRRQESDSLLSIRRNAMPAAPASRYAPRGLAR